MNNIMISPSILSADFSDLKNELKRLEKSGADMIHLDIMDGNFVKNITFGGCIVKAIREHTSLFLDVHLMINNPLEYIDYFSKAGANGITFHVESNGNPDDIIAKIRENKKTIGIALSPKTQIEEIMPYVEDVNMVLVMTVEPGFGGQEYIVDTTEKIQKISSMYENKKIQVDGGINKQTAKIAKQAGANVLVAGSYIFKSEDMQSKINSLR